MSMALVQYLLDALDIVASCGELRGKYQRGGSVIGFTFMYPGVMLRSWPIFFDTTNTQ